MPNAYRQSLSVFDRIYKFDEFSREYSSAPQQSTNLLPSIQIPNTNPYYSLISSPYTVLLYYHV